jgi:hypothetical protein
MENRLRYTVMENPCPASCSSWYTPNLPLPPHARNKIQSAYSPLLVRPILSINVAFLFVPVLTLYEYQKEPRCVTLPTGTLPRTIRCCLRLTDNISGSFGVHEKGNNESVKSQDFGKNENQDHADEQPRLLSGSADTSVTDDTDSETCPQLATENHQVTGKHTSSQTSQTDRQTSTQLNETSVERELLLEARGDKHRHDQSVDGNDTSHNDGNDVYGSLENYTANHTHGKPYS